MSGYLASHGTRVLVIGGGVAGPAAAIKLAEGGVRVEVIDSAENWGAVGTGVSLSPLTLRALGNLGLAHEVMAKGHLHDTLTFCNPMGGVINTLTNPRLFSPEIPAEGGIMRPILHQIMAARMAELGVKVRTKLTVSALADDGKGVDVTFSDGSSGRYDLVIGADGLYSKTREMVFPNAPKPKFTGQACWRAQMPLPADWEGGRMFFGPIKVGFTPCSAGEMYMYLLENITENSHRAPETMLPRLMELLAPFGGPVAEIRKAFTEKTEIVYRPLESILIEGDWHKGRVILIGDAVHATTPHLASGAGVAMEDALVLAEELDKTADYSAAMAAFMARRLPRAKLVVGNSLRLGELEQDHAPAEEMGALMMQSLRAIAAPY